VDALYAGEVGYLAAQIKSVKVGGFRVSRVRV
jgi:translation elongation factor EF-4